MARALVTGALLIAGVGAARADVKPSPTPCVNREKVGWRQVRDVVLEAKTLQYCTGDDCWSLELGTNKVVPVARRPPAPPAPAVDTHATVDETHVEFCARTCKSFPLAFASPGTSVIATMNAARTLGAVLHMPDIESGQSPEVIAFDLVKGKQVGRIAAERITPLDHGFLVDRATLYSPTWRKLGALPAPDEVWIPLGSTDLIALRDDTKGDLVIEDTTTAKIRARIATRASDPSTFFSLVAGPGAKRLYAIGWVADEGEVLTIDVASGKLIGRATPTVCAAGTHRVN